MTVHEFYNAPHPERARMLTRAERTARKPRPARWLAVAVLTAGGVICLLLALMPQPATPDYFPARTVPYTADEPADINPAPYYSTPEETTSHA